MASVRFFYLSCGQSLGLSNFGWASILKHLETPFFVFNWRDCTVKTGSARKLGQSPICHYPRSSAHWGYFRQFLTRLVQNLTLRNNCNLISSAHRTQRVVLSKRSSDGWWSTAFAGSSNLLSIPSLVQAMAGSNLIRNPLLPAKAVDRQPSDDRFERTTRWVPCADGIKLQSLRSVRFWTSLVRNCLKYPHEH